MARAVAKYSSLVVAEPKLKIGAKSNIRVAQKPLYPEAASDPFITEKWGRTKKAIEAQNVKRKKYTVYSGKTLIKISVFNHSRPGQRINCLHVIETDAAYRNPRFRSIPSGKLPRMGLEKENLFASEIN